MNTQNVLNLDDLANLLRGLRSAAGNPSFRDIQRRIRTTGDRGPAAEAVPSLSTIYGYFRNGRTRMDARVVLGIAAALGATEEELRTIGQLCRAVLDRLNRSRIVSPAADIPAATETFTGRTAERRRLLELAGDGPAVITIEGMAGIGKSELALRAAHDIAETGRVRDIRLFVNLRGYDRHEPPADPDAVIRGFLGRLGVPSFRIDALSSTGRLSRYRELLAGRDAVIVLDNAADAEQVEPLLPGGGALVLVTSRRRLSGLSGARLQLEALPLGESLDLLRHYDPSGRVRESPEAAAELIALCRNLPLELVAVGRQLRAKPDWDLRDHAERLRRIPSAAAIRPALAVSYANLAETEQRVFRRLPIHPGREYTVDAVAALTDSPSGEMAAALHRLADEHLLTRKVAERFELHDSIHDYARLLTHSDEPASSQHAALERLMDHYRECLGDPGTGPDWFVAERANLLACLQSRDHDAAVIALARATHGRLRLLGRYDDARVCCHQLLRVAQLGGDRAAVADALTGLAEVDRLTGDLDGAAELLREVLAMRTELGDGKGRADALRGLAQTIIGRDFDTAARRYRQALAIHRELGNRVGEAENLWGLLEIDLNLAGYDAAASGARQVIAICVELEHRLGHAYGLGGLGSALTGLDDLDGADDCFRRAWELCEDIGNRRGGAFVLRGWARTALAAGDAATAKRRLETALDRCADIGDRLGEAESRCGLGDVALAAGDLAAADGHYAHALEIYREIHDHPWHAQALRGLGNVAAARGETAAAAKRWRQALDLAEPLRLPMTAGLRTALARDAGSPPEPAV